MSLAKFLSTYGQDYYFDVMDEYDGYQTLYLGGFLCQDQTILEAHLELYYRGDCFYLVEA